MPDHVRCYRCGRQTIEVKYATFETAQAAAEKGDHIIRGGGEVALIGWREAERAPYGRYSIYPLHGPPGTPNQHTYPVTGTDPAILCPACEKEKA